MKKFLAVLILVFFISGCSASLPAASNPTSTQPTGTASTDQRSEVEQAYPAASIEQGYPVPLATFEVEPPPTLIPGMGTVSGVLQVQGKPVKVGTLLYLGTFLKDSRGIEYTAVVDQAKSPKTYTDENGHFSFVNLPPGRYSLILNNIVNQYLLFKPDSSDYIAIDLSEGASIDLGTLDYQSLPIPGGE